jgi:hypothetical protein
VYTRQAPLIRAGRPAVTVTLEAGGADTYTQRAIPGFGTSKLVLPAAARTENRKYRTVFFRYLWSNLRKNVEDK